MGCCCSQEELISISNSRELESSYYGSGVGYSGKHGD